MWLVVHKLFYGFITYPQCSLAYRLKTFTRAACTTHQDDDDGDDCDDDNIIIPDFVITCFAGNKFLMLRMGLDEAMPVS
jgi:hypothetical protein